MDVRIARIMRGCDPQGSRRLLHMAHPLFQFAVDAQRQPLFRKAGHDPVDERLDIGEFTVR